MNNRATNYGTLEVIAMWGTLQGLLNGAPRRFVCVAMPARHHQLGRGPLSNRAAIVREREKGGRFLTGAAPFVSGDAIIDRAILDRMRIVNGSRTTILL